MSGRSNLNIVHEAEAQRQYARVRIPAKLAVKINGHSVICPVHDISAGGFSVNEKVELFKPAQHYEGTLQFKVDGFAFSLPVKFAVKNIDPEGNRIGFELSDLGPREIASLRYLLTSTLNGELFSAGDMLNTLARENFTKSRNNKAQAQQSFGQRIKAMAFSGLFFIAGLGAFAYVGHAIYTNLFMFHATSAKIALDSFAIATPREGEVVSLVEVGQSVTKGQPLATIKAPMADFLSGNMAANLSPELVAEIGKTNISGSISSPCDCVVSSQSFVDGQYLAKATALFTLAKPEAKKYAMAWFEFRDAINLNVGEEVTVRLPGGSESFEGKIESINLPVGNNGPLSQVEVRIGMSDVGQAQTEGQPLLISKGRFY